MKLTILDDARQTEIDARVEDGRLLLAPAELERALGWSLEPQGLCKDATCMPLGPSAALLRGDEVDLQAFADFVGRPLALDLDCAVAALGDSVEERRAEMLGGTAPDFTLPDLSGRRHALGDYRGRKALLIAWASW